MNLVHPASLVLGALALPIIAFYILKVRLRRLPVSTLLFWEQIFEEKKARSLWQTLRHWISLLLQLAFLALLVFALADPIFRWQQARSRRLVLVVDNSASMNATDVQPTRLESAKAEARRLVDGLRLGDELAIIVAGPQPRVACGMTDHQRTLREAIDTIAPADGPTRITDAVALARRLLSGSEKSRKAIVLTDAGFEGAADLARQEDIDLIKIGEKDTGNVGITQLQARRSLVDPIGYEILVEVSNADWYDLRFLRSMNDVSGLPTSGERLIVVGALDGLLHFRIFDRDGKKVVDTDEKGLGERAGRIPDFRKLFESLLPPHPITDDEKVQAIAAITSIVDHPLSVTCRLEIDLAGDPIDVVPLVLQPGQRFVQIFEKTSADGGQLRARIERADALPADNTAWAILPKRSRQKVTLITKGNVFLEKVFEAIPLVDLEVLKVEDGQPVPAPKPTAGGQDGAPIIVYHRVVPASLPAGNVVVIEPGRSDPMWQVGDVLNNPVVAKQDKESPLMAHIRLDNVLMPEARKLTLKAPAQVLAESASGDPLYAIMDRTGTDKSGKVAVLTVDLDKSDLPLQTVFPIMMTNLLNWYGGTKGELRESLPTGTVAEVEMPADKDPKAARSLVLRSPDGAERPLPVPAGAARATVGPLDRVGVWTVLLGAPAGGAGDTKSGGGAATVRAGELVAELPCNLADRRESDLRPGEGLPERPANLAAGLAVRPIWYYLLASAWILTCWEWFLYQRRWID